MELLGWCGALLLAFCGIPQALKTFWTKKTRDLSWAFLLMWFIGEVFTLIYVVSINMYMDSFQYPLLFNYFFNLGIVSYLLLSKIKYAD